MLGSVGILSRTRTRLAITAFIILLIGGLLGLRTLATFTAQTTNPNNVFGNTQMSMTNVAGTVVSGSDCSTATNSGTCATLFDASSTNFTAGGSDVSNTVTITYLGSITTGTFGLYAGNYSSAAASSSPLCTATDPASKINLQIKQGSTIIYPTSGTGYGTLADFAATYTDTGNLLALAGGTDGGGTANVWTANDSSVFTIKVNLDSSADYTYEGCQSAAGLVWYAAQ